MLELIPLTEIRAARERIAGAAYRTPLVRLNVDDAPAEIYLKLENLQPIGSFKIRGAASVIGLAAPDQLKAGVVTISAGNMAQGAAWAARRLGLECTVIVPDHAPNAKLKAIKRLGATIEKVSFDDWWTMMETRETGHKGLLVHPFADPAVMAGNGTIGLEILEDLPDVDTVIIPFGGGGLSCGIASAIRAKKPDTTIFACEVDTAAPLKASFEKGEPSEVDYMPSFVDGIGGKTVFKEMWPRVSALIDDSLVVPLKSVASAVKLLVDRNRIVAEGAGATPVASALLEQAGTGKIVCVVSGGNIDNSKLRHILAGELP